MTADKSSHLVPKLRFPEFRRAEKWGIRPISKLAYIAKGMQLNRATITEGEFPVWNGGITPSGFHNKWNTEGDTITISEGGNSCGFVNLSTQRFWLGGHCYALKRLSLEIHKDFLFQLLKSNEAELMRLRVGSGLPNIQRLDLERFPVSIPPTLAEQQKIADCLGSLDDLIAAEERKLQTLRQHKQGLMQQLFPQPGETVPQVRFPEFQNAPAWSISPLDSICEVLNKRRIPITMKDRTTGPYPYYGASGIVDYVNDFIFDERLILVGEDGAKWGPFEETAFIADGKYWVNNHAHVLRSISLIDLLLQAYLVRSDLGCYVTGAAPPKLTLGKLTEIPIPIPPSPAEQRKIAGCLGSLDDLIAAEDRNLEAMRQHKQGLMQQLFPSLDGQ